MAKSGIAVDDGCVTAYEELKKEHSLRWCIFKVNDNNTSIVVDEKGPKKAKGDRGNEWEEFCGKFDDSECRFAVYDLPVQKTGNNATEKPVFIQWAGPDSNTKKRMVFSSSAQSLKSKLNIELTAQVDNKSELDVKELIGSIKGLAGYKYHPGE